MHCLKGSGGTLGLLVAAAHDEYGVAFLGGALVHLDEKIRSANAAADWASQYLAGPDQRDAIGHGEISFVESLAVIGIAARFDHVVDVDENRIAAVAAPHRSFDVVQGLRQVRTANPDAE